MGGRGPRLVRRAVPDGRVHHDERRPLRLGHRGRDRGINRFQILVSVGNGLDVPPKRAVAGRHVLHREGQRRRPVEGDVVLVVEPHEPPEAELPGERSRLARHPLHQVAVGNQRKHPVVHEPRELRPERPFGDGHAHRVPGPLPERPGRRFDARGREGLGMPRGAALPLPEVADVVEAHRIAREMQQGVEQHRAVARRKDEAVPVRPMRIGGTGREMAAPEHPGHGGRAHGQARVAGVRLLDRIDAEPPDGGDRLRIDLVERAAGSGGVAQRAADGSTFARGLDPPRIHPVDTRRCSPEIRERRHASGEVRVPLDAVREPLVRGDERGFFLDGQREIEAVVDRMAEIGSQARRRRNKL